MNILRLVVAKLSRLLNWYHYIYFLQDPEDEDSKLFDDHLIETVANCFSSDATDENIQVQVLKALLSIVSSGHIRVHGESLLMAVRTCYNIYLATRNVNYQATAKATLSQILNCIYNRMEQVCAEAAAEKMKAQQDREKLQQLEHANGDHDPSLQIDGMIFFMNKTSVLRKSKNRNIIFKVY